MAFGGGGRATSESFWPAPPEHKSHPADDQQDKVPLVQEGDRQQDKVPLVQIGSEVDCQQGQRQEPHRDSRPPCHRLPRHLKEIKKRKGVSNLLT